MIALIQHPAAIEAAQRIRSIAPARVHQIAQPTEDELLEAIDKGYCRHPRDTGKSRVYAACLELLRGFTSEDVAESTGMDRRLTSHYLLLLQRAGLVIHTDSVHLSIYGGKATKIYRVPG